MDTAQQLSNLILLFIRRSHIWLPLLADHAFQLLTAITVSQNSGRKVKQKLDRNYAQSTAAEQPDVVAHQKEPYLVTFTG